MINVQLIDARTDPETWAKFAADMAAADGVCGIDCETQDRNRHAGLNAFNNRTRHVFDHRRTVMTGMSFYPKGGDTAYYVNLNQADVENRIDNALVSDILKLKPEGVTWVSHNAPFELVMFEQCYDVRELLKDIVCTLQMAVSDHGPDEYDLQAFYAASLPIRPIVPDILSTYATWEKGKPLNPDQQFVLGQFIGKETDSSFSYNGFVKEIAWGYGLKKIVKSLFGFEMTTYEQVVGDGDMADLTGEEVCAYGADDAYWAVMVYDALVAKMLREQPSALVAFLETENPMVHVYADVWRDGLRINTEEVFARREQARADYAEVLRKFKRALSACLPFTAAPNEELVKWQGDWYVKGEKENWKFLRQRIIDWIDTEDSDDQFDQCFQVSNPIGNAWAEEKGIKVPKSSGKLNLTHYYQMRVILHDLLGHKLVRISGDITTDKDARARMVDTFVDDPEKLTVLKLITEMSAIEQAMKLYLTPYTQLMDPETGCMYSVISSMLASRRMAARFPNPMQLAKRGETTYVRGFYLADRDDHLIISADWSSVELVEIGDFSGDPEFAAVFGQIPYGDLHSGATVDGLAVDPRYSWLTEEEFLNELKRGRNPMNRDLRDFAGRELPPAKWVKFMRTEIGKGSNFNYFYSGALSTIAEKLGWDSATHWAAVDRYRERFHVAEKWRLAVIEEGIRNGFVTLPDGHRRVRVEATSAWYLSMLRKFADVCADPAVINFAELALPKIQTRAKNQFVNSVIQGSCATLAKRSILNIRKKADPKGARFMLPIHDELLFSVHRDYVPEFIPILREGMCTHPEIIKTLPLSVNVAVGRTFKPWDETPYSQLELDEAPVVEGLIPEEFDGKMLPPEFYPKVVDWLMAA